jgi:hypothetical protein
MRYFAAAQLLVALGDGYPAIRTLALRSLRRLDRELQLGISVELASFDTFSDMDERREKLTMLLSRLRERAAGRFDAPSAAQLVDARYEVELARVLQLLDLQSNHVISIGE